MATAPAAGDVFSISVFLIHNLIRPIHLKPINLTLTLTLTLTLILTLTPTLTLALTLTLNLTLTLTLTLTLALILTLTLRVPWTVGRRTTSAESAMATEPAAGGVTKYPTLARLTMPAGYAPSTLHRFRESRL